MRQVREWYRIDGLAAFFYAKPGRAYGWAGRYCIAPSIRALVVRERIDEGELQRDVHETRWGLRPKARGAIHDQIGKGCRLT